MLLIQEEAWLRMRDMQTVEKKKVKIKEGVPNIRGSVGARINSLSFLKIITLHFRSVSVRCVCMCVSMCEHIAIIIII